jgi:hypothetical protein
MHAVCRQVLTRAVADLLRSATSGSRPRSTSDQIERTIPAVSVRQASGCRRSHRHIVCLLDRLVRGKRFGEILSHWGWHVRRTSDVSFRNNAPGPDQAVIRPSSDQPNVMARRAGRSLKNEADHLVSTLSANSFASVLQIGTKDASERRKFGYFIRPLK